MTLWSGPVYFKDVERPLRADFDEKGRLEVVIVY